MTMPESYDAALWDDDEPNYEEEPVDLDPAEADAFNKANWRLRHIARIRAEKAAWVANLDAEIARLTIRRDTRVATLDAHEAWWARPVLGLHRALRAADETRTSIELACGTLRSKAKPYQWTYDPDPEGTEHPETFIAWALGEGAHPELVAERTITIKVAASDLDEMLVDLAAWEAINPDAVTVSDPVPLKTLVKSTLVKRDAKGKNVLVHGIEPTTMERPPGLTVEAGGVDYWLDTE